MNDISAILLTEIRIPFMGSVENARIQLWSAKEGARLTPADVLCEIETDKTVMEINAPDHGILARRTVVAGTDLKVGDLIGYLAPPDASPEQVARRDEVRAKIAPLERSLNTPTPAIEQAQNLWE